jgi:type 2 lantibiotic biosynthesis protein LanM
MSPDTLRVHGGCLPDAVRDHIARAAATLDERLAAPGLAPVGGEQDARALLDRWANAFAPGDRGAFARRLGWDGLDEAAVTRALAAPSSGPATAAWTAWLDRFLDEAARHAAAHRSGDGVAQRERVRPDPEPPFLEVWAALAGAARRALGPQDRFRPAALDAFERALVAELSGAGELALFQAFRASRARYAAYVSDLLEGGLAEFFGAYPALARQLAILAGTWVDATREMADRLRRDREAIAAALGHRGDLGDVYMAAPHLSDRHDAGRRVCIVTFTSGRAVVYKPRPVGVERAFHEFVSWLAARGLESAPPTVAIVERDGYGWTERVAQEPFETRAQVEDYFRRAGATACLLHALRGIDAHQENVVATRRGPVLVDAEMLLQPEDREEERDGQADAALEGAASGVPRSCLSTSFVTLVEVDGDGRARDVGGLVPAGTREPGAGERSWRALRSDDLHFVPAAASRPALANEVVLDGAARSPEQFAAEIRSGFAEAYRILVAERERILAGDGPLALFAGKKSRILFRPSAQYGAFLHALYAPRYQGSGLDRSVALEMLNRVFAQADARPRLWGLVARERGMLEVLDVPRVLQPVESCVLEAAGGETIAGHLVRSGLDAVAATLRAMDEADLGRQLDLLGGALDPLPAPRGGAAGHDPRERCRQAAQAIGDHLLARAKETAGGALHWTGAARGDALDLYRGQAGIALFLAALGATTGDARSAAAAAAALAPLGRVDPARFRSIGACDGIGSVVYALAVAGRLLGDDTWTGAAGRWAREITAERIERAGSFDVAGGAAGALLALLAIGAEGAESAWVRERIRDLARRLVAAQATTGGDAGAWPTADGRTPAGFAHGAAGVAYALTRAREVVGDAGIMDAVRRAHRHERRVFSPAAGNWPAAHEGGTVSLLAWCHGAPGIGLARALGLPVLDDGGIRGEIAAALRATLAAPRGRNDHLCCGSMGRAEALLVMGRALSDPEATEAATALAARVADVALDEGARALRTEGFEHRVFQPGFFRGLAGIGYQLLRTAAPERIPSVLGFQARPSP